MNAKNVLPDLKLSLELHVAAKIQFPSNYPIFSLNYLKAVLVLRMIIFASEKPLSALLCKLEIDFF